MASLLPNGEQTFLDANGTPLEAGLVYMYIPGTSTPKDTYQDSGSTILNTNPIVLDAAGRAVIYGTGIYRQVVYASNGDLIWDQLTADTAVGGIANGGVSSGSANAQAIDASTFSFQDGQFISFVAGYTNTNALTINVGGAGAVPVLWDSPSGPTPCTGGEVVAGNEVLLVYELSRGAFHIVNPATGNMARQNANAVAITGGTIQGTTMSNNTLILKKSALPTPTTSGDIQYATTLKNVKIGNGSTTDTYWPGVVPGFLYGSAISNNVSDATNDIDFASGYMADSTNQYFITSSALTKQLDATWAAGTNAGGRFSGVSLSDTWYHAFVIFDPVNNLVDAGFDTSVTAANRPAAYTVYRRVGPLLRTSGAIKAFGQNGDVFTWSVPVADLNQANLSTTGATIAVTVPTGISVQALMNVAYYDNSINARYLYISALSQANTAPSATVFTVACGLDSVTSVGTNTATIQTNTSAQIRYRSSASGGPYPLATILTTGYIDNRGRLS